MDETTKLFISGYPLDMEEMELAQLVSPYGDIHTIKIVRDKISRKPKGYAFLETASRKVAEQIIDALDGKVIEDKELTVNIREDVPVMPVPIYKRVERSATPDRKKRPRLCR